MTATRAQITRVMLSIQLGLVPDPPVFSCSDERAPEQASRRRAFINNSVDPSIKTGAERFRWMATLQNSLAFLDGDEGPRVQRNNRFVLISNGSQCADRLIAGLTT